MLCIRLIFSFVFLTLGVIRGFSSHGNLLYLFSALHQPILQLAYLPCLDAYERVADSVLM
jgi:hypothetical protein